MITNERLEEICQEQYRAVFRYCVLQLRNNHDADDATQDVFLLLRQKSATLEDTNIKAWLYDVAQNFINRKKAEYAKASCLSLNREDDLLIIEKNGGIEQTGEIEIEEIDDEKILLLRDEAIASLSRDEAELYEEVYINKKTSAQIAQGKGISVHAVELRRCRLKAKLKKIAGESLAERGKAR